MPGMLTQAQASGGGQSVFANPAFYGNVKMLTDSTMNQFQNQADCEGLTAGGQVKPEARRSILEQEHVIVLQAQAMCQMMGVDITSNGREDQSSAGCLVQT